MIDLCTCGHGHLSATTCHCGCPDYQPDREPDAIDDLVDWQINTGRGR